MHGCAHPPLAFEAQLCMCVCVCVCCHSRVVYLCDCLVLINVFVELFLSGRLVKLSMHGNGRLKLVRPVVAVASGVVFARARRDLVNDSRVKVLAVHAYGCHWISINDGCTADFQHAVSDIHKAVAKPAKPKPKPKQNKHVATVSEPTESREKDADEARKPCAC